MATTPHVPDATKFQGILVLADKIPQFAREFIDSIKTPDGKAVQRYNDLHTFVLELKDQVNGLYARASAADRSLQTGKRKDKTKAKTSDEAPNKAEGEGLSDTAKQLRKDHNRKAARAERRQKDRAAREPEVTEAGPDEP